MWTYRNGPNGVREQRRLMMAPLHDSAGCTGVLPWTYYVNDPSGLVLAVYHARQLHRSQLGEGCPDPPTPPTEPTRRAFFYSVEYRAYGPDGVNVVYERQNAGQNPGAWVKRYLTTDYQGSVRMAHDVIGDEKQHCDLFGAEDGQPTRRTGWLDREIDWETSPIDITFRTVDLVNRKYDPQRAVFLTSDPLWMESADASSYHYGYHDPMNMVDPWGLDPGQQAKESNGGTGDRPPQGVPGTQPDDTPQVDPMYVGSFLLFGRRVMPFVSTLPDEQESARSKAAELERWGREVASRESPPGLKLPSYKGILQGPRDPVQNNNAQKQYEGGYGLGGGGPTNAGAGGSRLIEWLRRLFSSNRHHSAPRVTPTVYNKVPSGKAANHIFRSQKGPKIPDTQENRRLIESIANTEPVGFDEFGKSWHVGKDPSGRDIYTYAQNGVVKGAGYIDDDLSEFVKRVTAPRK